MRLTGLWWWIDRWRKSTAYTDMTLEQQGAYRNLLDEASLRGGPLPNDEEVLAKACGDPRKWRRVRPAVMQHFELAADGCWHNQTLDDVLAKSAELRDVRGTNGRRGGLAKAANRVAKPVAKPLANSLAKPLAPDPSPDPSPIGRTAVSDPIFEDVPPPPLDRWLGELQDDYPQHRVTHGFMTSSCFFEAFQKDPRPPADVWKVMRANLESQKASHEWGVKGMAPKLEKWLRDGLWKHPAFTPNAAPGGKTGAAPAGKYDGVMEG